MLINYIPAWLFLKVSQQQNIVASIVLRRMQNFLQSCHNSHLGMKQNILICRILIIGSINIINLQEQLKQYPNGCN